MLCCELVKQIVDNGFIAVSVTCHGNPNRLVA